MTDKSPENFPEARDYVLSTDNLPVPNPEVYRDDEFYFDFVIFKVENCLFRVPKHELEHQSTVFRDMFTLPLQEGSRKVEGKSDGDPILLESVSRDAFKLLLKMLYPPESKDIAPSLTLGQCASILKLTHMWDFQRIEGIIKDRIRGTLWNEIPCADKIQLAHEYEITDWYADAYYDLAIRKQPLSVEEGRKLGLEISIKMGQVRERVVAVSDQLRKLVARRAVNEVFLPETKAGAEEEPHIPGDKEADIEGDEEHAFGETPFAKSGWGFAFASESQIASPSPTSKPNGRWHTQWF